MEKDITQRLNVILKKITSEDFLKGKGLGNEIGFYIFDYSPEDELVVREHIKFLMNQIAKNHKEIKPLYINLFELIYEMLKKRGLLDKVFERELSKGSDALLKDLRAPVSPEKIITEITSRFDIQSYDLVLMGGVGNVWPLIRSHLLLNNLQPVMKDVPLILFYPGKYDGQSLKLFGTINSDNYYRAFRLVS